jgi:phosphoglycolate phosphatase-like HAD superfamily hydrolase
MANPARALLDLNKEKEFLVCIDSDGCSFDTMEIKHKECFIPNTINEWDLQPVSKYAREAAEFVNLYSKWRGTNRFPALISVIDILEDREEVLKRGFKPPDISSLRKWVETETKLCNPALKKAVDETNDPVLAKTLRWTEAVNETIANIVRGIPPFPYVRESLEVVMKSCDIVVVSATPNEALLREWQEHDIAKYIKVIAGQEMGTKKECIGLAKDGRYEDEHILMIGDAPGDLKAARANNALFYPINPGYEDNSWKRFYEEAFERFIKGRYKGAYEEKLIAEFDRHLPSVPPWKK